MSSSSSKSAALLASQANCSTAQSAAGLADLLARVEAATGPDRELDFALARWQGWTTHTDEADPVFTGRVSTWWARPGGEWDTTSVPPAYTRSLDAALALVERVLLGWVVRADIYPDRTVWSVDPPFKPGEWLATETYAGEGKNSPLALLAALLKALLSSEEQPSGQVGGPSDE